MKMFFITNAWQEPTGAPFHDQRKGRRAIFYTSVCVCGWMSVLDSEKSRSAGSALSSIWNCVRGRKLGGAKKTGGIKMLKYFSLLEFNLLITYAYILSKI
jgi:hypothetical protein